MTARPDELVPCLVCGIDTPGVIEVATGQWRALCAECRADETGAQEIRTR